MAYCTDVRCGYGHTYSMVLLKLNSDKLVVSGALGMMNRSFMPDYKQGQNFRINVRNDAGIPSFTRIAILEDNGVEFIEASNTNTIYGSKF